MMKLISSVLVLVAAVTLNAQTVKPIYVVHVNLGNTQLSQNVIDELSKTNPNFQNRPVVLLRPNLDVENNPFAVSKWGRQTGLTRPGNEIKIENTPVFSEKMVQWFEDLEAKDIHPEIFIINGHHLVGMGFESDNSWETKYKSQFGENISLSQRNLFFPTIVRSRQYYPVVARFFDNIKMVFVGGCEGLANLEPKENGLSGRYLSPEEIKSRYFGNQKSLMLGNTMFAMGLSGYKDDLVKVYGDSYTDKPNKEVCVDSANHLHCAVYDVNRIMPDSGLWDGNHTYNMPYQMKRLFPKAYGIFGFATPSPTQSGVLWKAAFKESREKLGMNNFFQPLFSDSVTTEQKKEIVQRMRISWTKATHLGNRGRVSGSITPAFPELDANGIFAFDIGASDLPKAPAFAPYEARNGSERTTAIAVKAAVVAAPAVVTKEPTVIEAKKIEVKNESKPAAKTPTAIKPKAAVVPAASPKAYSPTREDDPMYYMLQQMQGAQDE